MDGFRYMQYVCKILELESELLMVLGHANVVKSGK